MIISPDATVSDIRKNKTTRNYSDRLFRKLFNDEKRAIELCNALIGEHYTEDTPVKLCSINENSLLARYNDVAFVVEDHYIVLCEHQSTNNVNMPLRFLPYISDTIYTQLTNADKLYENNQIYIPTPKFYMLYNGKDACDKREYRLSAAFNKGNGDLELVVRVIDIKYENSNTILSKSPSLHGYSFLVAEIRKRINAGCSRDKAIKDAIKYCIEQGILVDFLINNYEEVCKMLNYEYDAEAEERVIRQESERKGELKGELKGEIKGRQKVARKMLEKGKNIEEIMEFTDLEFAEILKLEAEM